MTTENTKNTKQNPFIDLIVSIVIPTVILMKLSGESNLGPMGALLLALAFPLLWGLYELVINKKKNFVAILGIISVLLTGGIGVLELDNKWLAIKEAAIPAAIGIGGVLLGAAIANSQNRNGGRRHRANQYEAHVDWCYNRYRSYNERTDKYRANSGRLRYCNSPYN